MNVWLLVFIGGGAGSLLRYFFSIWFADLSGKNFPWHTFIANIVSSFLLGFAIQKLAEKNMVISPFHWFFIVGFCGGFSTFSAFSYEILLFIKSGNIALALSYITVSVFSGLLFAWLGYTLG